MTTLHVQVRLARLRAVHAELLNWTKIKGFHGFWYHAGTRCRHPFRSFICSSPSSVQHGGDGSARCWAVLVPSDFFSIFTFLSPR